MYFFVCPVYKKSTHWYSEKNQEKMMRYSTADLFAQFMYSSKLSYEDLYEKESSIKAFTLELLAKHGARFANYEAMGDALHVHCVFDSFDEELAHSLCDALAPHMDSTLEGRLLFVCRDFSVFGFYTLAETKWQEAMMQLPFAGEIGKNIARQHLNTKRRQKNE